jgi:hypothetical protein
MRLVMIVRLVMIMLALQAAADQRPIDASATHMQGWRYTPADSACDEASMNYTIQARELAAGSLSRAAVDGLVNAFRACGVIVLNGGTAVPPDVVERVRVALREKVDEPLKSRRRLRKKLKSAMRKGQNLRELFSKARSIRSMRSGQTVTSLRCRSQMSPCFTAGTGSKRGMTAASTLRCRGPVHITRLPSS